MMRLIRRFFYWRNRIKARNFENMLEDIIVNTPNYAEIGKVEDDKTFDGFLNERIALMSPSNEQIGCILYVLERKFQVVKEDIWGIPYVKSAVFEFFKCKNHTIYYENESKLYRLYRNREMVSEQYCPYINDEIKQDAEFFKLLYNFNHFTQTYRVIMLNHEKVYTPIELRYLSILGNRKSKMFEGIK